MLRRAFLMFHERGIDNVRLNVDRDNAFGAWRLYEDARMRLRRRWIVMGKTLVPPSTK